MFLLEILNNMQIVVGVFGAEMAVSFRSSRVGSNVGIFGQFRTAQVGLETALGWSYLCDPTCVIVLLGRFKMNCLNCLLA